MTNVVVEPRSIADSGGDPVVEDRAGVAASPGPHRRGHRPGRLPDRREVLSIVGNGLTIVGVVMVAYLVYLLGLSALAHGRDQTSLVSSFEQSLAFLEAPVGGTIDEGAPVALLDIPRLGVHEVVVEGTSASMLKQGPGHLRTSPLPGQQGNVVVAGRRVAYGGPFRHLDRLERGDRITAVTGQGEAIYEVTRVAEVRTDERDVLTDAGDDRLTLITSTPAFLAEHRLVATAELLSSTRGTPAGRPTELRSDELGLHGDRSSAVTLLLWSQALLVAAMGTAWLYRRWARWPAYLVSTPVLALVVLLVFDSFTPVLPSTL